VAAGGWLGLSGISPGQLSIVTAALAPLVPLEVSHADDWAAVVTAWPPANS